VDDGSLDGPSTPGAAAVGAAPSCPLRCLPPSGFQLALPASVGANLSGAPNARVWRRAGRSPALDSRSPASRGLVRRRGAGSYAAIHRSTVGCACRAFRVFLPIPA
jgi:hypothetical protein